MRSRATPLSCRQQRRTMTHLHRRRSGLSGAGIFCPEQRAGISPPFTNPSRDQSAHSRRAAASPAELTAWSDTPGSSTSALASGQKNFLIFPSSEPIARPTHLILVFDRSRLTLCFDWREVKIPNFPEIVWKFLPDQMRGN